MIDEFPDAKPPFFVSVMAVAGGVMILRKDTLDANYTILAEYHRANITPPLSLVAIDSLGRMATASVLPSDETPPRLN
jgi:hypothetical protein